MHWTFTSSVRRVKLEALDCRPHSLLTTSTRFRSRLTQNLIVHGRLKCHVEHNSNIWSPTSIRDIEEIVRIQRRFTKKLYLGYQSLHFPRCLCCALFVYVSVLYVRYFIIK